MKTRVAWWGALTAAAFLHGVAVAADKSPAEKEPVVKVVKADSKQEATGVSRASVPQKDAIKGKENVAGRPVLENGVWVYTVSQTVDGNVAGRTSAFSESGRLRPARVRVGFVQKGRIVSATVSDESGRFLVKGIPPGVYTVIAAGAEGIGVSWARVTSYAEKAKNDEVLELTLAATGDAILLPELLSGKAERISPPVAKPSSGN